MKALICGSRSWGKPGLVDILVLGLKAVWRDDLTIIHGGADGADMAAHMAACRHHIRFDRYPADWKQHGKAAGPIRNQQMLDEGRPDVVFAFTNELASSRGTADMVRRAKAAGVPVYVIGAPADA